MFGQRKCPNILCITSRVNIYSQLKVPIQSEEQWKENSFQFVSWTISITQFSNSPKAAVSGWQAGEGRRGKTSRFFLFSPHSSHRYSRSSSHSWIIRFQIKARNVLAANSDIPSTLRTAAAKHPAESTATSVRPVSSLSWLLKSSTNNSPLSSYGFSCLEKKGGGTKLRFLT